MEREYIEDSTVTAWLLVSQDLAVTFEIRDIPENPAECVWSIQSKGKSNVAKVAFGDSKLGWFYSTFPDDAREGLRAAIFKGQEGIYQLLESKMLKILENVQWIA